MPWYYAEGALQNGPVTDDEFGDLVRNGKVRGETLVWREGMANWQPYSMIATPPTAGATPPPSAVQLTADQVLCQQCGQAISRDNAIQHGGVWVCANCKPLFLQRL